MRCTNQSEFNEWLLKLRNGELNNENNNRSNRTLIPTDSIEIPQNFLLNRTEELITSIYGKTIDLTTK